MSSYILAAFATTVLAIASAYALRRKKRDGYKPMEWSWRLKR